jgi:hypothetical protein
MKHKRVFLILLSIFIISVPIFSLAEELPPEEEDTCLDADSFSRYILAEPLEIMPNIDESTTIYFNFQCDHNTNVQVLNGQEVVLDTILSNHFFSRGDNQFSWDGKINGDFAEDGTYYLKIIPNDGDSEYAFSTQVQVYNFKHPSLLEIYGEIFKSQLREMRREEE